jgi:hypothetical protein
MACSGTLKTPPSGASESRSQDPVDVHYKMSSLIGATLARMNLEWSRPRRTSDSDLSQPDLELVCRFAEGGATDAAVQCATGEVPPDVTEFWRLHSSARLFVDETYGQWGLDLLAPSEATQATAAFRSLRPKQRRRGDLVLGRFLGDSDLLIVRCERANVDYGSVLVALRLDPREAWYAVAPSFGMFLSEYADAEGRKYWTAVG